ncbi:hypothetical protein GQ42DRAFT_162163, partial [Ramicandelaber brevisporus]
MYGQPIQGAMPYGAAAYANPAPAAQAAPRLSFVTSAQWAMYEQQFLQRTGGNPQARIGAQPAREVLVMSGLPAQELGAIWSLADLTKSGTLSLVEFVLAMHLANSRRNGAAIPPSLQPNIMQELWSVSQALANRTPAASSAPVSQAPAIPPPPPPPPVPPPPSMSALSPMASLPPAVPPPPASSSIRSVQSPPSAIPQRPPTIPPPPFSTPASMPSRSWDMSESDRRRYQQTFAQADISRRGVISGADARSLFRQSGLPDAALGKIWALVDSASKGSLNSEEFSIAMHLITMVRNHGMPVPDKLPDELQPKSMARIDQTVDLMRDQLVSSSSATSAVSAGLAQSASPYRGSVNNSTSYSSIRDTARRMDSTPPSGYSHSGSPAAAATQKPKSEPLDQEGSNNSGNDQFVSRYRRRGQWGDIAGGGSVPTSSPYSTAAAASRPSAVQLSTLRTQVKERREKLELARSAEQSAEHSLHDQERRIADAQKLQAGSDTRVVDQLKREISSVYSRTLGKQQQQQQQQFSSGANNTGNDNAAIALRSKQVDLAENLAVLSSDVASLANQVQTMIGQLVDAKVELFRATQAKSDPSFKPGSAGGAGGSGSEGGSSISASANSLLAQRMLALTGKTTTFNTGKSPGVAGGSKVDQALNAERDRAKSTLIDQSQRVTETLTSVRNSDAIIKKLQADGVVSAQKPASGAGSSDAQKRQQRIKWSTGSDVRNQTVRDFIATLGSDSKSKPAAPTGTSQAISSQNTRASTAVSPPVGAPKAPSPPPPQPQPQSQWQSPPVKSQPLSPTKERTQAPPPPPPPPKSQTKRSAPPPPPAPVVQEQPAKRTPQPPSPTVPVQQPFDFNTIAEQLQYQQRFSPTTMPAAPPQPQPQPQPQPIITSPPVPVPEKTPETPTTIFSIAKQLKLQQQQHQQQYQQPSSPPAIVPSKNLIDDEDWDMPSSPVRAVHQPALIPQSAEVSRRDIPTAPPPPPPPPPPAVEPQPQLQPQEPVQSYNPFAPAVPAAPVAEPEPAIDIQPVEALPSPTLPSHPGFDSQPAVIDEPEPKSVSEPEPELASIPVAPPPPPMFAVPAVKQEPAAVDAIPDAPPPPPPFMPPVSLPPAPQPAPVKQDTAPAPAPTSAPPSSSLSTFGKIALPPPPPGLNLRPEEDDDDDDDWDDDEDEADEQPTATARAIPEPEP